MDFTIVTFGDFGLMVAALNGVAAITNHSSFMFIPLIGVMTGMFFLTARYLTSMRIDLHHLLTGFVLFNAMFLPKVTVLVESATGQVQPVANVPIGLATPLSITTVMGRYFAEQFETVFSVTSNAALVENGYMDALTILLKIRDFDINKADGNSSQSTGLKQDIHKTIQSYLTTCFLYDAYSTTPTLTFDQVKGYSGENIWEAVKTEYVNIDAMSYLGTDPTPRNCANLWSDLNTAVFSNPAKTEEISKGVLQMLGKGKIATMNYNERVGAALEAIRLNSDQATRYMYNSLMISWLSEAESLYAMKASDMGATIMKTQASSQNNLRWAAEQSQFERYAKPIISFIELFVVAATPIMAFVIVAFGVAGLSLAFKYLLMLVWVAFWAPTLALANFFIHYKVVEYIEYLASQSTTPSVNENILNLGTMPHLWSQLQDWVGVGGMMAAATPALTLMLIYGTSQTAVNLASKLNQGERVDEKLLSPDLAKQAPITSVTSSNVGNAETGIGRSNSGIFDTSYNFGQGASSSLKSSESALQSLSQNAQTSYGLNNSSTAQATLGEQFQTAITNSKDAAQTRQYNEMLQTVQRIGQAHGLSETESKQAAKQAMAQFGAGMPLAPLTFGAQFSKSHSAQQAAQASQQYNEDVSDVLSKSELFSKSNSDRKTWQDGFNQTNAATIQNARQESRNQSEIFSKMNSLSKLISATKSLDANKSLSNVGSFTQLAQKFEDSDNLNGTSYTDNINAKANELAASDPDFAKRLSSNKRDFANNFANSPGRNNSIAAIKTLAMSRNPEASGFFYENVGNLLNVPDNDMTQGFRGEAASQGIETGNGDSIESRVPSQGSVSNQVGEMAFKDKTPSKQALRTAPTNTGQDKGKIKDGQGFSGKKMLHSGTQESPPGNNNTSPNTGIRNQSNGNGNSGGITPAGSNDQGGIKNGSTPQTSTPSTAATNSSSDSGIRNQSNPSGNSGGITENGSAGEGGIKNETNPQSSPAGNGIAESAPPSSGKGTSTPARSPKGKASSSTPSSTKPNTATGGTPGDMARNSGGNAGSLTIGKPNEEFVDGTANILPAAGSAVPLAAKRAEENPIYLSGVTPQLQGTQFAEKFRGRKRDVNQQAIAKGKEDIGHAVPGYDRNSTPSQALVKDGLDQDKALGDAMEELMPGGGRAIYEYGSAMTGAVGLGRNVIKQGAKQILKEVPKNASKKVKSEAAAQAKDSIRIRTGAFAAGGVLAREPAERMAEWWAAPTVPNQPPPQVITPPPSNKSK